MLTATRLLPELEDLREREEAHAINLKVKLAESWFVEERRSSVCDNLEHVSAKHRPASLKALVCSTAKAKVNFLSIRNHESLATRQTPNKHNFVFFTAAFDARKTVRDGILVGKPKTPAYATFGGA
jgi:hypothetical protein